jgi:hypothetical protein
MRTVILTDPGVLELNWMWLPTWIGMNARLKQSIEQELAPIVQGKAMTDQELDAINSWVIARIVTECPLPGVSDYLDGLKFIQEA